MVLPGTYDSHACAMSSATGYMALTTTSPYPMWEPIGYNFTDHEHPFLSALWDIGCHSSGAIKNESTEICLEIFPEFGDEFDHLFRRDLSDHLLGVTSYNLDDDLVDTCIVAK